MGNCQAIDAASLVIQHPNGKVDKMYWPIAASEIMKMNPGHYVALLITTTICHTTTKTENTAPTKPNNNNNTSNSKNNKDNSSNNKDNNSNNKGNSSNKDNNNNKKDNSTQKTSNIKGCDNKASNTNVVAGRNSVRITRVKLLRPTETLALGHVYRLITTKAVMKGLVAKKQAKMRKSGIEIADSEGLKEAEKLVRKSLQDKTQQQVSRHGQRSRTASNANGGSGKPKTWQPSLNSISEAAS